MRAINKTAIITGITGQDGAYLTQYLLGLNYTVVGLTRSYSSAGLSKLMRLGIDSQIQLEECDLMDYSSIIRILQKYKPDEFYNLAAQSSVAASFNQPIGTIQFNSISVLNILEAIRSSNSAIRFYQASSSEMFGRVPELPIRENNVLNPVSPYAISKATAHWIVRNYREAYGIFACSGILFNHESSLRDDTFFVKKVIESARKIKAGKMDMLHVGNIMIKRDFGASKEYVKVMHAMLQHPFPDDYVVASGTSVLLKDIIDFVFDYLGVPANKYVVDDKLFRPSEINDLYGDSNKAKNQLGWNYQKDFFEVLREMIDEIENGIN
jgi:GDPmannose 4,6-dehydratase